MSACSLLTRRLAAVESRVKRACHKKKNTHNPHKSSQSISRDARSDESGARRKTTVCLGGVQSFQSCQVVAARKEGIASCTLLTIRPLFCGRAARRGPPGSDALGDTLHYSSRAEQDQSEVTGLCLDTRSFSSEWLRGTGCKDNAHTLASAHAHTEFNKL